MDYYKSRRLVFFVALLQDCVNYCEAQGTDNRTGWLAGLIVSLVVAAIGTVTLIISICMLRRRRQQEKQRPASPGINGFSNNDYNDVPYASSNTYYEDGLQEQPANGGTHHPTMTASPSDVDYYNTDDHTPSSSAAAQRPHQKQPPPSKGAAAAAAQADEYAQPASKQEKKSAAERKQRPDEYAMVVKKSAPAPAPKSAASAGTAGAGTHFVTTDEGGADYHNVNQVPASAPPSADALNDDGDDAYGTSDFIIEDNALYGTK